MKKVYIYSLNDPITNEIRYIGKTIQPLKNRLKCHLHPNKNDKTHRANWILNLKNNGLKPTINLIEECSDSNWVEREIYWIDYYSKLTELTNHSKGGNGGHIVKISTREKLSIIYKEKWKNEEYRTKMSEMTKKLWENEELKKNRSDEYKLKWKNEEYRTKMSEMTKKLWENEEYRENRLSDEAKKKISISNTGKKASEETKKLLSEINKKRWKNNEYKEKMNRVRFKKKINIDGIEYESIKNASDCLKIDSSVISRRLKSDKHPNYKKVGD
jgi:hypothetical protein